MSATDVVVALAGARKASQLYPPTHPEHVSATRALIGAVGAVTAQDAFTLNVHQGRLYDRSTVLAEGTPGVAAIRESFESRRIESMTFHAGFGERDAAGLVEVLSLRPSPDLDAAHGHRALVTAAGREQ